MNNHYTSTSSSKRVRSGAMLLGIIATLAVPFGVAPDALSKVISPIDSTEDLHNYQARTPRQQLIDGLRGDNDQKDRREDFREDLEDRREDAREELEERQEEWEDRREDAREELEERQEEWEEEKEDRLEDYEERRNDTRGRWDDSDYYRYR